MSTQDEEFIQHHKNSFKMDCKRYEICALALRRLATDYINTQDVFCAILYYTRNTRVREVQDSKSKQYRESEVNVLDIVRVYILELCFTTLLKI